MSNQSYWLLNGLLAYLAVHALIVACRLPFSSQKLQRLKTYGGGVACWIGILAIISIFVGANPHLESWVNGAIKINGFLGSIVLIVCMVTTILLGFAVISLGLGQMLLLITSWSYSDSEHELRSI